MRLPVSKANNQAGRKNKRKRIKNKLTPEQKLREQEKKHKELIELHERQQRLSKRNSPNVKTRTSATKQRWKGWRYYEEPSEVITYRLEDLDKIDALQKKDKKSDISSSEKL